MTPRDAIWVGLDVGKAHHHAAAVDSDGELLWSVRVANDQASIEKLVARATATGVEVRWAVDLTSAAAALLLASLVAAGQRVLYVPAARSTGCPPCSLARARPTPRTPE